MRQNKRPSFNRNLRVGEELRHALSLLLQRGAVHEFSSIDVPITVSEVRVSSDLRHATAYVLPLGGRDRDRILQDLRAATPSFRHHLAQEVKLQFMPQLRFELDESFEQAEKIERLLQQDKKRQVLNHE